jgi:hypothetical protein
LKPFFVQFNLGEREGGNKGDHGRHQEEDAEPQGREHGAHREVTECLQQKCSDLPGLPLHSQTKCIAPFSLLFIRNRYTAPPHRNFFLEILKRKEKCCLHRILPNVVEIPEDERQMSRVLPVLYRPGSDYIPGTVTSSFLVFYVFDYLETFWVDILPICL